MMGGGREKRVLVGYADRVCRQGMLTWCVDRVCYQGV